MDKRKINYLIYFFLVFALLFFCQQYLLFDERAELLDQHSRIKEELETLQQKIDSLESINKRSFVNVQKVSLPVVFCGDTLDMDNHFLRERVEREFYSLMGNQGQLQLYFKRTERFFPMIEGYLKNARLPEDLKYLSVHESALLPKIRSRSNAVGLWQFMYATGRLYKLKINRYIDERRDPEKATAAAMRLLNDLYKRFKNWPLVLAAYNGGQGRIQQSMKKQNSNSLIDLFLPEETERYYFKIVATKIILSQPEKFGFMFEGHDYFPSTKTVEIEFTIHKNKLTLEEIASAFEMSLVALKEFNPQLINSHLIRGSYKIRIPSENYSRYLENKETGDEGVFSLDARVSANANNSQNPSLSLSR